MTLEQALNQPLNEEQPKPRKTRGPYNTKKKQAAAAKPEALIVGVISQGVRAYRDAREIQKRRPPFFRSATTAEEILQRQLWATLLFLQELHGSTVLGSKDEELDE